MIASVVALLLAASAPTDPAALEVRAVEQVQAAFTAAKLPPPTRDAALSIAARDLAGQLLAAKLANSALSEAVPAAISRAGGWDPAPRTLLLSGTSPDGLLQYLRAQPSLTEEKSEVVGVGIASNGQKYVLMVVTAHRYADLKPFPRVLQVNGRAELDITLRAPLQKPQLVLTGPDGHAETNTNVELHGERLEASLQFPKAGRYSIEVVGRGADGPRVAALFTVAVGAVGAVAADDDPPEPANPIDKIDAVLARINRVRAKAHAKPLIHDHALDVLALEHAEDMAKNHFFAHVSPTRGDLHARLAGRYAYQRAGENLGEAGGALLAERAIENSPAHLENTLDPTFTRIGLALFPNQHQGGEVTLLLTEIFATPPERLNDPAGAIYKAINEGRAKKRLAALGRDTTLESVAREHLKEMVHDGMLEGQRDAQDAAIEAYPALQSVAVDLMAGSTPDVALKSSNALSSGFNRVGVAAQLVDNKRYGGELLWICVLYGEVGSSR